MLVPSAVSQQTSVSAAIEEVVQTLSPDVIRIRYDFATDWSGDPAIYFRILLSDEASESRLVEVARRVEALLAERLDFQSMGLYAYRNFRSESEQTALRELSWA